MTKLFLKSMLLKLMIAYVAFLVSSCQDTAPEPVLELPQEAVTPLLDRLELQDGSQMQFTYAGTRLMRIVHQHGSIDASETGYSAQSITTYDYSYTNEQLDAINITIENSTRLDGVTTREVLCRFIEYEYDAQGKATSLIYYLYERPLRFRQEFTGTGELGLLSLQEPELGIQDTRYSWREGNLRTVKGVSKPAFTNQSLSEYQIETYDDKPNLLQPLAAIWLHDGYKYSSKNNPTKISLRNTSGGATSEYTLWFEYEYNEAGYPVRIVERYATGAQQEIMKIFYQN